MPNARLLHLCTRLSERLSMGEQASVGLPETGACDEATWNALLGPETIRMRLIEAAALVSNIFPPSPGQGCDACSDMPCKHHHLWGTSFWALTNNMQHVQDLLGDGGASPPGAPAGQGATSNGSLGSQSFSSGAYAKQEVHAPSDSGASSQQGQAARLTSWPVLREGEGGAEVSRHMSGVQTVVRESVVAAWSSLVGKRHQRMK